MGQMMFQWLKQHTLESDYSDRKEWALFKQVTTPSLNFACCGGCCLSMVDGITSVSLRWSSTFFTKTCCLLYRNLSSAFIVASQARPSSMTFISHFTILSSPHYHLLFALYLSKMCIMFDLQPHLGYQENKQWVK